MARGTQLGSEFALYFRRSVFQHCTEYLLLEFGIRSKFGEVAGADVISKEFFKRFLLHIGLGHALERKSSIFS
jgi:hypothetical protein